MSIPHTGLPVLCYMHLFTVRGMALKHTSIHNLQPDRKEKMLEVIRLRVAELQDRIEMMNEEDDETEEMVEEAGRSASKVVGA